MQVDVLAGPGPQTRISFDSADLDPATVQVTVLRTVDDVDTTVRSSLRAKAIGGYVVTDWEAPAGPVSYRAQMVDASGNSLGDSASVTASLTPLDTDEAWLSDPLDPNSAIKVNVLTGLELGQSRPGNGSSYYVGGRFVVLAGVPNLLSSLPFAFSTETAQARKDVLSLVQRTNGLILVRTSDPVPLPRLLYCWAQDAQPSMYNVDGQFGYAQWSAKLDEQSEMQGPPAVGATPWSLYRAAFPTWADMRAAYSTWMDAKRNPPSS